MKLLRVLLILGLIGFAGWTLYQVFIAPWQSDSGVTKWTYIKNLIILFLFLVGELALQSLAIKGSLILPWIIELLGHLFIYGTLIGGSMLHFYQTIEWYDEVIHFLSGLFFFWLGLFIANLQKRDFQPHLFQSMIGFSVLIGLGWEFIEFTVDFFFDLNLQEYIKNGVPLVGRLALHDTMTDLLLDGAGALLASLVVTFIYVQDPKQVQKLIALKP